MDHPLVLLATVSGLYLLVRSWQNKTQQDLRLIQNELRSIQTTFRQLDQAAQKYSVRPEPFGSK
jgi:hypothetical protein